MKSSAATIDYSSLKTDIFPKKNVVTICNEADLCSEATRCYSQKSFFSFRFTQPIDSLTKSAMWSAYPISSQHHKQ